MWISVNLCLYSEFLRPCVHNLTFQVCQIAALLYLVIFTQFCSLFLQKYPLLPQNTPKSTKNAHFPKTTDFDITPAAKDTYIDFRKISKCTNVQGQTSFFNPSQNTTIHNIHFVFKAESPTHQAGGNSYWLPFSSFSLAAAQPGFCECKQKLAKKG